MFKCFQGRDREGSPFWLSDRTPWHLSLLGSSVTRVFKPDVTPMVAATPGHCLTEHGPRQHRFMSLGEGSRCAPKFRSIVFT